MSGSRMTMSRNEGVMRTSVSGRVLGEGLSRLPLDERWLYALASLCLLSLLAFLYLGQASYVARQIGEMESLESVEGDVIQANNALRLQIARYEQVSRIQGEARAMGFGPPEHVEYVEVVLDEATPLPQGGTERETTLPSPAAPAHLPGWWGGALHQFRGWIHEGMAQPGQAGQE